MVYRRPPTGETILKQGLNRRSSALNTLNITEPDEANHRLYLNRSVAALETHSNSKSKGRRSRLDRIKQRNEGS